MALTELEQAKADVCIAQAMGMGMTELLRRSILSSVIRIDGEPDLALADVSRGLREGLRELEIDPVLSLGFQTVTREEVRKRIGVLLRLAIDLAAQDLGLPAPSAPQPH